MSKVETANDDKLLKCGYCPETFDSPTDLETHIKQHVQKGDKLDMTKDPEKMTFDEKKLFFDRVYQDGELRKKLAEKAVLKSLKDIMDESTKSKEVYVPAANAKIKWRPMSVEEWIAATSEKDDKRKETLIVYNYLKHDNELGTEEEFIKKIPPYLITNILIAIEDEFDFLIAKPLQEALKEVT